MEIGGAIQEASDVLAHGIAQPSGAAGGRDGGPHVE
jgi:hypothetical protein